MRLRTLRLRNYRRFRDAGLEFPDGVIAVTGPNGAGKTTIIEAMTWCLFGHDAARTQKELIKRTASAPGDDVEVRLEFELDGVGYVVSRRLRGKSQQTEAQIEIDGALVVAPGANSSDLASKRIAKALGMDRTGFQATVVAGQGDLSALSDQKSGERKRLILGLLGIDAIDDAITFIRTRKREASLRLEQARIAAARAADLRVRREALERGAILTAAAHDGLVAEATQRAQRWQALQAEAQRLSEVRQRQRDLRSRLDGLQRALHAHHDQAVRMGGELQLLDERQRELERLRNEAATWADLDDRMVKFEQERMHRAAHERLVAERDGLARDLTRWQEEAKEYVIEPTEDVLDADILRLRAAVEDTTVQLTRVDAHAQHLELDRKRLQTDAADHGDQWRDIKTLGPDAACPMCQRTLGAAVERITAAAAAHQTELKLRVQRIQTEHETLRTQAATLRAEQDRSRTTLVERERQLEAVRRRQERLRVSRAEHARIEQRLAEVATRVAAAVPAGPMMDAATLERDRAARDRWRQQTTRLEAEVARVPRLKAELATRRAEAEAARNDIEAASRDLVHTPYQDGSWENAQRLCDSERSLLHDAERQRDVLAERLAGQRTGLAQLVTDLATLAHAEDEVKTLQDEVRLGEALAADRGDVGILPEFRRHMIGRVRPALARSAGDLVAEMTNGRYTELAIEDDYSFQVYDGAQAWPVERFSGGEVDIINLAVRLAVSELLARARRSSRLQFVALDEVLAAQDETRRRNVLHALKGLGRHFRQVLLVTHLDEVRERVDHVIRVVLSADGTSRFETSWTEQV